MSSGLQFMYGHAFGSHSKKPHMDTVNALNRSNTNPYITSPIGVDPRIAQPGPRNTPFLPGGSLPSTNSGLSYGEYVPSSISSGGSSAAASAAAASAAALPPHRLTTRPSRVMNTVRFRDDPVSSFAEGGAAVPVEPEPEPTRDIPEPTKEDEDELIKLISEDPKLKTLGNPVTSGQRMVMKMRKKYTNERKTMGN